MCDLSVTRYTFLENFYSSECVHCAEKFPVSTANEIFLPTSVSNAMCMKYQRRWYKICAHVLCAKLLNLKINVRLSAEICLPQKLSARNEHALHFVQNLEIPKSVARNFDRNAICMKYQRRWYKICARGLCGKLCKIGVKTVDFPFFGPCLWCCSLVLEVCFAFQCDFFRWKRFPTFLILLSCPLQWKTLFLYHPLTIRMELQVRDNNWAMSTGLDVAFNEFVWIGSGL